MAVALKARPKPPTLVIVGEFFIDLVFYGLETMPRLGEEVRSTGYFETPGGGLATTALAAQKLGTRTAAIARVGADAVAQDTWPQLARAGIDTSACEVVAGMATARTACIAYAGDRMMVTHDPIHRQLDRLLRRPAARLLLAGARHVHLACSLRQPERWLPAVRRLRARGVTLSADFGWSPGLNLAGLGPLLQELHFVFPNQHEAHALTGARADARALARLGRLVRHPVIKQGAQGSLMLADGRPLHAPAAGLGSGRTMVDATGAGDAFNGGFLHAWLQGWSFADCLRAGNICGAAAVTAGGGSAGLPDRRTFLARMGQSSRMHR